MLLAIDIGNTNISCGVFERIHLVKKYAIPTQAKDYSAYLAKIASKHKVDGVIVCSVVPRAAKELQRNIGKVLNKRPVVIGRDIVVPVKNLYRNPRQVGCDRLVNAYAGIILYGYPLIAVDFGTAVTFDIISRKKEYLGGMILPGLRISLEALGERTALLPKIRLKAPPEFIGRDTENSMLSGVVHGFAALTDGVIKQMKPGLGKGTRVIGTGGNINLIAKYCRSFDKIDQDLTLKGLNLLYNRFASR